MLDAVVAGTTDPAVLADLVRGKLRTKQPALRQALVARFRGHHGFLVAQILAHLGTIPGVNTRTAEVLIAELGVDMRVFPTAGHLASWAGRCPGNNESAGKHRSGRTRTGNRWLRGTLIEAALSAGTHAATGALAARSWRVGLHCGHKKAIVAVAHAILVTAYHLLARHTTYKNTYKNPGADSYDRRHTERVRCRAIDTLERQGFRVSLESAA